MCYFTLSNFAVLIPKKPALLLGLAIFLWLPACANSPWAQNVERSLAPDPSLEDGSLFGNGSSPDAAASPGAATNLPANFPAEIPRYPNAEFVTATQSTDPASDPATDPASDPASDPADLSGAAASRTETRWRTPDAGEQVRQFYQEKFQSDGWQLGQPPTPNGSTDAPGSAPGNVPGNTPGAIVAERDGLRVTVAVAATATSNPANGTASANGTEFTIDYQFADRSTTARSPNSPSGNSDRVGPVPPEGWGSQTGENATSASPSAFTAEEFTDLNQAPTELQSYIADLAKLGALRLQPSDSNANSNSSDTATGAATGAQFKPNSITTRREYARWLVTANNLIYVNQPARQIRLAVASDRPAFQDVPASDPDFGTIQGLANAGLIPSPLSGDSTSVTFRPDAPLTRENLILWKVPVDLRKALPNATIEAVQQTWGFQDTAQIDPKALRALLADFQNGDQSNIRRAFGYTTIFQPDKSVTRAEAAAALWFFGVQGDGLSAKDILQPGQQGG